MGDETATTETERKNLTGYVRQATVDDVEEWADEHGFSKSRAVDELLTQALADEDWQQNIQMAKDALDTPDLSAFVLAAFRPDGTGRSQLSTRSPGLNEDSKIEGTEIDGETQALLLCLAQAAEQQRTSLDMDEEDFFRLLRGVWKAMYESGETAGVSWSEDDE